MRLTRAGVGAATLVMAITPATGAAETPRCLGRAATITGGSGDVIRGTPGDDVITAYGDEYDVLAGGGNDLVCADSAYDVVQGGPGDDHLRGRVSGGLYGGRGDDQIDGTGRSKGGSGDDRVTGGGVWGGPDQIVPKHGDDEVHGGGGSDSVHYFFWPEPIEIDLAAGWAEGAGSDFVEGVEEAYGGDGDDVLRGDDGPNVLFGYAGNDRIEGLGGDDSIDAGAGIDVVDGGDGNDVCDNAETPVSCEEAQPVPGRSMLNLIRSRP